MSPLYLKALARRAFQWQAAGLGDEIQPKEVDGSHLKGPSGQAASGCEPSHKVRTEEASTPWPLQKRAGFCHPILLPWVVPFPQTLCGSSESSAAGGLQEDQAIVLSWESWKRTDRRLRGRWLLMTELHFLKHCLRGWRKETRSVAW